MSEQHNPYAPPQARQLYPQPVAPPAAQPFQRFQGGRLPDLGQAFNDTMSSFTRDLGPYAMAGLGLIVISIPISMVMVLGIYACMALVVFGAIGGESLGGQADPENAPLLAIALSGGMLAAFLVMITLMMVLLAPVTASLMRAVAQHQRGERRLEFGAVFSTLSQDAGAVCGQTALTSLLGFVGGIFCYFPGLIVSFVFLHGFTLVALYRMPAVQALKASVAMVRESMGWNLKYFGLVLLIYFLSSYIPVIGPMFALAFLVRVSRERLGDGAQPMLELQRGNAPGAGFPR